MAAIGLMAIAVTALVAFVALTGKFETRSGAPRAAILDQLSATSPNGNLIQSVISLLQGAGFRVDYYSPSEVNVDLYERLPQRGYKIILVRSHSTGQLGTFNEATGATSTSESLTSLFTNEIYSVNQHLAEQRDRTLDIVRIAQPVPGDGDTMVASTDIQKYFGITPSFISRHTTGGFGGAVILLMGCEAMSGPDMARALRAKGAAAVIGWDRPVTLEHTDDATSVVMRALLANDLDAKIAVDATMRDLGKDPVYGASLVAG